ncbi:MAG: nucleotidyltransferase family protein, partial [Ruminococcus sp.]|nr:nucleotidyltransferase family protein [Ruminococcus sp.]
MKTAAIISEFNPFHNGHKYLVDKIKCEYAQSVVAIMSGNFVQRGDVAIIDKHRRAQTALEN